MLTIKSCTDWCITDFWYDCSWLLRRHVEQRCVWPITWSKTHHPRVAAILTVSFPMSCKQLYFGLYIGTDCTKKVYESCSHLPFNKWCQLNLNSSSTFFWLTVSVFVSDNPLIRRSHYMMQYCRLITILMDVFAHPYTLASPVKRSIFRGNEPRSNENDRIVAKYTVLSIFFYCLFVKDFFTCPATIFGPACMQ